MLRKLTLTVSLLVTLGGVTGQTAQAKHERSNYQIAYRAVCHFFTGSLCQQAMSVVRCETGGTYSPWATNGQYVNIFQMGSHERATFGWHVAGSSVWAAAKAARAYYDYEVRNGYWGWSPWQCHP